jgi:hypothetical protein
VTDKGSTPSLAEVLQAALDSFKGQLHVAMPGIVVSYDEAKQKANVQPQVKSLIIDQDGNEESLSLPELPSVPVVFPRGGGFFVSFPLQPGDQVLLVICDRELNVWKSKGGDMSPQDPRTHHLADAVAIPGCYPFADVLTDAHASNMVLGKDGGAQVHVKTDEIDLYEENAADFVALATDVKSEIEALRNAVNSNVAIFNAHTHLYLPGPGGSTPTAPPATAESSPPAVGDVAATKVKAT